MMRFLMFLAVTFCLNAAIIAADDAPMKEGRENFGNRIAYLQCPDAWHQALVTDTTDEAETPVLLVHCHPSGGNAQPQFKWMAKSNGLPKRNIFVLCPQSAGRAWSMRSDGRAVRQIVDRVIRDYRLDPEKVLLSGHSSGGMFAYSFGLANDEMFYTVVPIAGALRTRIRGASCDAPIFHLFHSSNDRVVPIKNAHQAIAALDRAGYVTRMITDNIQHNAGVKAVGVIRDAADFLQGRGKPPKKLPDEIVALFGGEASMSKAWKLGGHRIRELSGDDAGHAIAAQVVGKLLHRLTDEKTYDFQANAPDEFDPAVALALTTGPDPLRVEFSARYDHARFIQGENEIRTVALSSDKRWVKALVSCALRAKPKQDVQ